MALDGKKNRPKVEKLVHEERLQEQLQYNKKGKGNKPTNLAKAGDGSKQSGTTNSGKKQVGPVWQLPEDLDLTDAVKEKKRREGQAVRARDQT